MNPYSSFSGAQYTNADVMDEMQRSGYGFQAPFQGYGSGQLRPGANQPADPYSPGANFQPIDAAYRSYPAAPSALKQAEANWQSGDGKAGGFQSGSTAYQASATFQPADAFRNYSANSDAQQGQATWQSSFDGGQADVGSARRNSFDSVNRGYIPNPSQGDFNQGDFKVQGATSTLEGILSREEFEQVYGNSKNFPPGSIYEGAIDVQFGEGVLISQRVLEEFTETEAGLQQIIIYEKVIEVPQIIVKETRREIPKPEIIERIVEVPNVEIKTRQVVGPPQVQYQEQIIEVPQVMVEERIVHVPRREVQERLIEVPKVEFVERIEYDDYIEYREVPVDKIVEVPEIEYRIREVEQVVPQTYVQDYYVDRYQEVPVTQVQEVERIEQIPVAVGAQYLVPRGSIPGAQQNVTYQTPRVEAPAPVPVGSQFLVPRGSLQQGPTYQKPPMPQAPSMAPIYATQMGPPIQSVVQSYATYDPDKAFDAIDRNYDDLAAMGQPPQSARMGMPAGQFFVPRGTFRP